MSRLALVVCSLIRLSALAPRDPEGSEVRGGVGIGTLPAAVLAEDVILDLGPFLAAKQVYLSR